MENSNTIHNINMVELVDHVYNQGRCVLNGFFH